jgi:hypothetical protein
VKSIPISFVLLDGSNTPVTTPTSKKFVDGRPVKGTAPRSITNTITYDSAHRVYFFNLNTKPLSASSRHKIRSQFRQDMHDIPIEIVVRSSWLLISHYYDNAYITLLWVPIESTESLIAPAVVPIEPTESLIAPAVVPPTIVTRITATGITMVTIRITIAIV